VHVWKTTYRIGDAPDGDADALRGVKASTHNRDIFSRWRPNNFKASNGDLVDVGGSQGGQGGLGRSAPSTCQVHLSANTLDKARVGSVDSVDQVNEIIEFGVGGIEAIVIDVKPKCLSEYAEVESQGKDYTWRTGRHRVQL